MNFQEEMMNIINNFKDKKTLLLHSCCAPCSSYVIETLAPFFNITICYYNPNIAPIEEYEKRKEEQIRFIKKLPYDIEFLDVDYDNHIYEEAIKDLKQEKEGGSRCTVCFNLRLKKVAYLAKEKNMDFFATTLTVSPYKNAKLINEIGKNLEKEIGINYLPSDFKKKMVTKGQLNYQKNMIYTDKTTVDVYIPKKEELIK